jgi:CHAT domain-containing protein
MGKPTEARASVEEALRIDRLNQYKLEAGHVLYLAWITAGEKSKLDQAIQLASSARELAIRHENYLVFMQASTSLAHGYVQKGRLNESISLLERSRDGLSEDGKPLFQHPATYRAAMSLPYPRIVFLEAMALAYKAGQRPDEALKIWQELYEVAKTAGFTLAAAEAAHGIADLYQMKKEFAQAITYYSIAAEAWAKGGNAIRRIDALGSEAFMLSQSGQGDKAVHTYEELLSLVKDSKDFRRQFIFNLAIAETTQPKGDTELTTRVLQQAESLLSPDLTLAGVDPSLVLELYFRLADLYATKNEKVLEVIALEKAMTPAEAVNKLETMAQLDLNVKKHLDALHVQETASKAYQSDDLTTTLLYFELLQHFEQTDAKWRAVDYNKNLNDPIVAKLIEIVFKLIAQPNGGTVLETNLQQLGPVAQAARLPILVALSNYYMAQGNNDMVVKFATAAWPYLRVGKNDQPHQWDVQLACELAFSLLRQKDIHSAVERVAACLGSAQRFADPQLLAVAHQTNVWVLEAAGKRDEAQESVQFLLQHAPQDPSHFVELTQLREGQGNTADAIEAQRTALRLFETRKDLIRMAAAHLNLARLLSLGRTGNNAEEHSHLEAALALYKQLNDSEGQARASMFLGKYYARAKDSARAHKYLDTALNLSRQAKKAELEATVLFEIGQLYRSSEDPSKALDSYRNAAEIYHALNDLANEALQLRNEAWVLGDLRRPEEAFQTVLKAKYLADLSGSWHARYWVRLLLAALYVNRGEYEYNLTALREARAISDSANQTQSSAWADLALAEGLASVGEWEQALDLLNSVLPIFRQFKDTDSELEAYGELTGIYGGRESELKDLDKAIEYYRSAYHIVEKTNPERVASLGLEVVEIYWQQKRFKEAISKATEALNYYERTKNYWGQASALISLAEAQRSDGDIHAATISLARAEPLVKRTQNFYMNGRLYYGQANLHKQEGRLKDAIAQYERVIDLLEQFKSGSGVNIRSKGSETYGFIYDELVDTYYLLGSRDKEYRLQAADKALQYTELNKSRVFTNSWGRTFIDVLRLQLPAELQEKERALSARQVTLQSELAEAMSGQGHRPSKQVQEDLLALASQQSSLENEVRQTSMAYAEIRYPRPVAISDLPLHSGEVFIEFKMLQDALLVWIIEGSQTGTHLAAFYKVDRPRQWFDERIVGIRSAFNRGDPNQFDPKASEELFQAIFPEPYTQFLINAGLVIFVPDDILFLLPFEILSPSATQSQYILLNTPTAYFPSAAAFRLSRAVAPSRRNWPAQFFGLADPITTKDDERYETASIVSEVQTVKSELPAPAAQFQVRGPLSVDNLKSRGYFFERLPETATEVKDIAGLFSTDTSFAVVRTGMDATKRELLQTDLGRFRFIHFATHGFLPVEPGRDPALVLSYDGKAEERMMLTLPEILQLKLHAEMVVLSACNTGSARKVTRAEGVASLGTAFLQAGASSVTVSLWAVDDKSTAMLMQEFYRNLLGGMTKSKALATARASLVSNRLLKNG